MGTAPRASASDRHGEQSLLRRQAGVISYTQALAAGVSPSAVQRRLRASRWLRLYPRVFLAADHPRTDEVRLRSAVPWAGPGAVAHGVSAAWWHVLRFSWHDLVERPDEVIDTVRTALAEH